MKPQAINPQETTRAEAFEFWMNAPNPMVTFFKKIDETNLVLHPVSNNTLQC